ncbi:MAG: hypothetical protein O3A46_11295 [Candidatus Poribacteria bacterium]|nr:hypothetical protein [Candidatus Poribacteria bacterium]
MIVAATLVGTVAKPLGVLTIMMNSPHELGGNLRLILFVGSALVFVSLTFILALGMVVEHLRGRTISWVLYAVSVLGFAWIDYMLFAASLSLLHWLPIPLYLVEVGSIGYLMAKGRSFFPKSVIIYVSAFNTAFTMLVGFDTVLIEHTSPWVLIIVVLRVVPLWLAWRITRVVPEPKPRRTSEESFI